MCLIFQHNAHNKRLTTHQRASEKGDFPQSLREAQIIILEILQWIPACPVGLADRTGVVIIFAFLDLEKNLLILGQPPNDTFKGQIFILDASPRNNEGMIRPFKGKKDPNVERDALMVMIPSELQFLVQKTQAEELSFSNINVYHLYRANKGTQVPLTLAGPFLGAPQAVIAMEKLIVLGAKRIWVLGWCGSLQPDVTIGHLIIPTGAVSEEGTSNHYPVPNRPPESTPELNRMLEEALIQQSLPFSKGSVWTTDALYRETPDKVKTYQDQGILAVEMEISALMTVALYRSVAMAGLLVVSDELFQLKWRPGFSNPLLKKSSREAGKILLRLAGSVK